MGNSLYKPIKEQITDPSMKYLMHSLITNSDTVSECDSGLGDECISESVYHSFKTIQQDVSDVTAKMERFTMNKDLNEQRDGFLNNKDIIFEKLTNFQDDIHQLLEQYKSNFITSEKLSSNLNTICGIFEVSFGDNQYSVPSEVMEGIQEIYEKTNKLTNSIRCSDEKKQKLHANQLFLLERCLVKFKKEVLRVLKSRYKTWKQENPDENRAPVLFHYTKIQSEIHDFQKKTINTLLGVKDTEKNAREEKMIKREQPWRGSENHIKFHEENFQDSLEEADEIAENLENLLKSNEKFISKKQKLNTNLILVTFLMLSAHNSVQDLRLSEKEMKMEYDFETFHKGVVNWIFLFLVALEEHETSLPSLLENNLSSCLSSFRHQMKTWLRNGIDEFDFCD